MTRAAFMDVWASAVRDEVRRNAELIVPGFAAVDAALDIVHVLRQLEQ
jgi:hypothetical protein